MQMSSIKRCEINKYTNKIFVKSYFSLIWILDVIFLPPTWLLSITPTQLFYEGFVTVLGSIFWDFRENVSIRDGDKELVIMVTYFETFLHILGDPNYSVEEREMNPTHKWREHRN